jgi:hypothetical protein
MRTARYRAASAVIKALRASVPHATVESIATVNDGADAQLVEDLAAYQHHFAAPPQGEDHPCLRCEKPLKRSLVSQLMGQEGGFEWGLVHGQGHCRNCGWPATLYHFIRDRNGNDLLTIRNLLLQQHPDDIELRGG